MPPETREVGVTIEDCICRHEAATEQIIAVLGTMTAHPGDAIASLAITAAFFLREYQIDPEDFCLLVYRVLDCRDRAS